MCRNTLKSDLQNNPKMQFPHNGNYQALRFCTVVKKILRNPCYRNRSMCGEVSVIPIYIHRTK